MSLQNLPFDSSFGFEHHMKAKDLQTRVADKAANRPGGGKIYQNLMGKVSKRTIERRIHSRKQQPSFNLSPPPVLQRTA